MQRLLFFLTLADGVEENKLSTDLNKIPLELVNVSGVYILYHKDPKNFYIGSASSLRARFKQHILNSTRPYRGGNNKLYTFVRENGGWGNMAWGSILTSPNHIIQFLNQNPNYRLNLHKIYMLRSLTQFEVRVP